MERAPGAAVTSVTCARCRREQPRARLCVGCGEELVSLALEGASATLAGRSFPLLHLPFRMGRAVENELCLADPSVSRLHARIVWDDGHYVVEDLGSRYGVFVDGTRVQRAALAAGSRLQLGDAVLVCNLVETGPDGAAEVTYNRRGAARQDLLLAVIEAISSTLVLEEVLEHIVDAVVRITRAERGFLLLVPEEGDPPAEEVAGLHLRMARSERGPAPGVETIAASVAAKAKLERGPAVTRLEGTATTLRDTDRIPVTTVVTLPLREPLRQDEGPLLGLIYADNPSVWTTLDGESLRAADALARHAALAIHNARLYEREQRANAALLKARDQALEASRAKSSFLSVMSHELHTPLNAVIGYGEMCQERAEERHDAEDLEDLGKLLQASKHLLRLVDDVLDVSELESGGMRLSPESVALRPLLEEVVAEVVPVARKHDNSVELRLEDGAEQVVADRRRLRQAVLNLAQNAARFSRGGQVQLQARRDAGGALLVEISDTGPGMTPEQLARVLEPFTQADGSSTRRHGGLGLGLAISRKLCEAMGGELWLVSTPGRGFTATVRLPPPGGATMLGERP